MNVHSSNEGNRHIVSVCFTWCAADRTNDLGISISYAYDPIGNRTSASENGTTTTYAANSLNQYTALNPATTNPTPFSYDADGNMTSDGTWSFGWDAENRLIEVQPLVTNLGSSLVQYMYDAQSRRIARREFAWMAFLHDDPAWRYAQGRAYRYGDWNLLQELKPATTPRTPPTYIPQTDITLTGVTGSVAAAYVWGLDLSGTLHGAGGIGGLLVQRHSATNSPWFSFCDANGNITDLLDDDGILAARYEYDAFGNTTVQSGTPSAVNPFRFSSKYCDPETGHCDFGYRFYIPSLGRWCRRDLLEESGGPGLYLFVDNSPVDLIDPWGLSRMLSGALEEDRPESGGEEAREVMRYIEKKMRTMKDKKGNLCFIVEIRDLVTSPLESIESELRTNGDNVFFIGHGALAINGNMYTSPQYYWDQQKSTETVEELLLLWEDSSRDDAIEIFKQKGINPQNVYGCYLAPEYRRHRELGRKCSSTIPLRGLFVAFRERLEEFAKGIVEKGCKCQRKVVIYEADIGPKPKYP